MPSDSLSINPKSTSSNQESVASSASSQHGRLHEHGPTIDGCFEQKKPERGKTEGLERAGDLDTSTASSTEICAAQESGRLGEVSDVLKRSRDIFNHSKPSSASSKRDSTLVVGGLTKPSASRQFSGVEKLPNEVLIHIFSNLAPSSLAASAIVSSRFNELITSPHAWRAAFLRYFPEQDRRYTNIEKLSHNDFRIPSSTRSFNRLTAFATWKSEYVFRTRLLGCIRRIRRQKRLTSSNISRQQTQPGILYDSGLSTAVTHLHANFGNQSDQRSLTFAHASAYSGTMSQSNPILGELESSNCTEPLSSLTDFNLRFPGIEMYGMGSSVVIGNPNVMDVSSSYGMVLGEGFPEGDIYHRNPHNKQVITFSSVDFSDAPHLGIPCMVPVSESVSSIWIAKSKSIPSMSGGLVVMISGSSAGIISTYGTLGKPSYTNRRLDYKLTSRCVLSPGVPIVAIEADDCYTPARLAQNRIWAVALNALGEVFYLTKFPRRSNLAHYELFDGSQDDAWLNGRTVQWHLVESSRRIADSNSSSDIDGSYSPRSSWDGMCLSRSQLIAECREIDQFFLKSPEEFRRDCIGWNMRRAFVVDFAGNGDNYAGECIVVFNSCNDFQNYSSIRRYLRKKDKQNQPCQASPAETPALTSYLWANESYGTGVEESSNSVLDLNEEWTSSALSSGKCKGSEITAVAIDMSNLALKAPNEDPALWSKTAVSPSSDISHGIRGRQSISDIPGQRGRFVAAGTNSGIIMIWDIRMAYPAVSGTVQKIEPVRTIQTGSPQITSLALTALYVVHGGSDGLVQAWDPMGSQIEPLRTIRSRSIKTDRRDRHLLRQRNNLGRRFRSVTAIRLDPDPMTLRGVAACGFTLKYWSYNDWSTNKHNENKGRRKRAPRQSNDSFMSASKLEMKTYIASEKHELEEEEADLRREKNRLANRYGTDLGSEEEMLAYATMLSRDYLPQSSSPAPGNDSVTNASYFDNWSSTSATYDDSSEMNEQSIPGYDLSETDAVDSELALAIQRSLIAESPSAATTSMAVGSFNGRSGQGLDEFRASSSSSVPGASIRWGRSASRQVVSEKEQADIDLALQLSLSGIQANDENQGSQ